MALSLYDLNNNKATRDVATTISDGLMSATDKQKLDGIHGADLVKKDGSIAMDDLTIGTRKSGSTVGTNSFAQGNNCEASGNYSHAEGSDTTASGNYSHAEGSNTTASGNYSHAEGSSTTASGTYSHAEGINTTASGSRSHAEGINTTASGSYSHAQNRYTIAQGYSQTAIGRYNIAQGTGTGVSATDDAFIIGNGTSTSATSNAFKVSFDGKAWTQEGYYVGASNYAVYHTGNISNSALTLANTSGIKGTGTGSSNLSYFNFFENDGTTRQGYIGYGDSAGTLYIWNDLNTDVYIKTNGAGKAKINGNEIYHAGNISSSALNLANASGIKGTGTGQANESYFEFNEIDGTTRQGYIGFGSANDNMLTIANTMSNGDVNISTTGKAKVNGNEIYHAGNISSSALNLANASGIKGTGTGTSNLSYFNFYESDGTTLDAFIGINSSSNNTFTIGNLNTNANIDISPSPGGKATVNGDTIVTSKSTVPPVPNSTGKVGQVAGDANYFYYCYNTNTWARYAKSTW